MGIAHALYPEQPSSAVGSPVSAKSTSDTKVDSRQEFAEVMC